MLHILSMIQILAALFMILTTVSFAKETTVIDFDLTEFSEENFLKENKTAILPLGDEKIPFNDSKPPLILVHGIRGNPYDMQGIVDRFKHSRYQIYVLAYEDFKIRTSINGKKLSRLLGRFKKFPEVTVIAHSMGGIIVRQALVELVKSNLLQDKKIRFFSIDTPWHGFDGPADDYRMVFARPFLPDALEDMRARSGMFIELNSVTFPRNIEVNLAFAEEGPEAFGPHEIYDNLVLHEQFVNFDNALSMSSQREIPVFPGDHMTVLDGPYLDYLQLHLE